jgi:hypothetical protein
MVMSHPVEIIEYGNIKEFEHWLESGVDLNKAIWTAWYETRGGGKYISPLNYLALKIYGTFEIEMPLNTCSESWFWFYFNRMKALLLKGVSTEVVVENGQTPLFYFCANNSVYDEEFKIRVIKLLIEHGANVNATDSRGMTPLHCAASSGFAETARILLEQGADMLALNVDGRIPAHVTGTNPATEFLRQVLYAKAENCRDILDAIGIGVEHNEIGGIPPDMIRIVLSNCRQYLHRYDILPPLPPP